MTRPIEAYIDRSALLHNAHVIRKMAPMHPIWAVVKANAYGHGLEETVHTLKNTVDGFALIEIDRAVRLRQIGIQHPILLLEGFFDRSDCQIALKYNLTPVIHQPWQLDILKDCIHNNKPHIYVKHNTGMNRVGFPDDSITSTVNVLESMGCQVTLITHFANADLPAGIDTPLCRFNHQMKTQPRCAANSAATFRYPDAHYDWIRPGIVLYGSSPFSDQSAEALGLKPVMTLRAGIIATQSIQAGESVGYGSLFRADRPTRVGIVACGYADGYPRTAPTGTPVMVQGKRTRLLGRVSMDMLCIDLTDCPDANIGTWVTLWGDGLPADEVATASNTIAYELFCRVTARVPFVYSL